MTTLTKSIITKKTPRYLTLNTFKDILRESGLDREVVLEMKYTILNTINNLPTLMDDTNKTYVDSFIGGGFTNNIVVRLDDVDSIVYVLLEIGFKEEEIRVEDVRLDYECEDYDDIDYVEVYCMTNRYDFIRRLISYKVMGRVIPTIYKDINIE
jgi:hypothetical protein